MTHDFNGTDFPKIAAEVLKGTDAQKIGEAKELLGAWAYLVHLETRDNSMMACRKITESWNSKNVTGLYNMIFKNETLLDIDADSVFRFDPHFDFFGFEDTLFILNKKKFESVLNFRAGMEANRDNILNNFHTSELFVDVEPIRKQCANNLRYLRKLAMIEKNGYYKDQNFMIRLREFNQREGGGLTIKENKIVVTDANLDTVLTFLNNDFLRSPINSESFVVEVKKKILPTAKAVIPATPDA